MSGFALGWIIGFVVAAVLAVAASLTLHLDPSVGFFVGMGLGGTLPWIGADFGDRWFA